MSESTLVGIPATQFKLAVLSEPAAPDARRGQASPRLRRPDGHGAGGSARSHLVRDRIRVVVAAAARQVL